MSDTSPQPTPTVSSQPLSLSDTLNQTVNNAPELAASPGLAVGVASSGGDPTLRAPVIARAATAVSDTRATVNVDHSSGGILGSALNWLGNSVTHVVGDVAHVAKQGFEDVAQPAMNLLNKPLQIVQHEYRYLHDVEASHGPLAALSEGIGLAAGAVVGGLAAGPAGIALGAEAAAGLEGQAFYRDSWARTGSASYVDPNTHQPVSLGRDLASALGIRRGTEFYNLTSGAVDATFDMGVNIPGLGILRDVHSVEGAGGALGSVFQGYGVIDGEKVEHAWHEGEAVGLKSPFKRATEVLAGRSVGEIRALPAFNNLPDVILNRIAQASTSEDVMHVFRDAAAAHELTMIDRLPTLSRTRAPLQAAREAAGNASMESTVGQNALVGPGRWYHRFSPIATSLNQVIGDSAEAGPEFLSSMKKFDLMGPTATKTIHQLALYTENNRVANDITNAFNNMPELRQRIVAYKNLQMRTIMNMGDMRLSGVVGNEAQETHLMLKQVFTDPEQAQRMEDELKAVLDQGMFGKDSLFGFNAAGKSVSMIRDTKTGTWQYGAAILDGQVGNVSMLDLAHVRRIGQMLHNADSLFSAEDRNAAQAIVAKMHEYAGRIDDIGYHDITQGIFKPLVLLTPSYAMHISLAEMIPNALRLGIFRLARAAVVMNMTKLGIRMGDLHLSDTAAERFMVNHNESLLHLSHMDALTGLAWRVANFGRGVGELGYLTAPMQQRLQRAVQYIEGQGGELVDPALSSGHALSDMVHREETATQILRHAVNRTPMKGSGMFGAFGNEKEGFADAWGKYFNAFTVKDGGSQVAARELLRELHVGSSWTDARETARRVTAGWIRDKSASDPEWGARYLRNNEDLTSFPLGVDRPVEWDAADEFASVKVDALEGITRGENGTLHDSLLQHVADGKPANSHEFDAILEPDRANGPMHVPSEEVIPNPDSSVQRIANIGFTKVLNPMVNFLSRQPMAFEEYNRALDRLTPAVDKGVMTADQADVQARTQAAIHGVRFIHNLNDRTQWTVTMRNWAPFWFAQEQAYRRMGRLLSEDPVAFRKYQLMIANAGNVGQIFQNPKGQSYFVVPHTGWMAFPARTLGMLGGLGGSLTGSSPVGLGWSTASSSVMFPLSAGARPDLGPLAAIPTQFILGMFAEHAGPVLASQIQGVESAALGASASQSIWAQFVPNTIVDRLLTAAFPAFDERSFDAAFMSTLQTLQFEGKVPAANASPMVMQAFLDRWRNQTRIMYIAKALVGAITPISPEIEVQNFGLPAELTADITQAGSVTAGITEFLQKHPDATPYTVYQSTNPQGFSVTSSVTAENWINDNMALIRKYPNAALSLMPPETNPKFNQTVYNEQIAQHLRTKWFPGEVLPNGELEGYLAQLYIAAGNSVVLDKWYPIYKAQIANMAGQEKYQAELNWQASLATYAKQNPVWGQWWNSDQKAADRTAAVQQMQAMFAAGDEPKNELSTKVAGLLADYQVYENQLTAGEQDSFAGETQATINATWQAYLDTLGKDNPDLRPTINALFLTLPTPATTTGG